jgi:arginyl-tRNA synthetase
MNVLTSLSAIFGEAFAAQGLEPAFGEVVVSGRPDLGQFQCNGALPAAKQAGRNPRDIAQAVVDNLRDRPEFGELSLAGPGFVNIVLNDSALVAYASSMRTGRLGIDPVATPQRVLVDYGGPNVAKDMHVGHLRSTIIGDSITRIGKFVGHDVLGDAHFGDWGTQMGQVIVGIKERMPDLPYFDPAITESYPNESPVSMTALQEIYPDVSERANRDPDVAEAARLATLELQQGRPGYRALWKHLVAVSQASQRADFHDLGVDFDLWHGESTVHNLIEPLIDRLRANGLALESDGALVIDVAEPGDRMDIPPLLLMKGDGAYLYTTTDVATLQMRMEELARQEVLYVVDARQALHFEQVFRVGRKAGLVPPATILEHIKFGTMNGPDGKPFQTRKGGVVKLRDLINMVAQAGLERLAESKVVEYSEEEQTEIARLVGLAALKFGELSNHRQSDYLFDLERFTSLIGKTGPYLQYAVVRTQSILREANEAGWRPADLIEPSAQAERRLILELLRTPDVIDRAWSTRAPNHIAEFAYELAQQFNRFYEECHILREADQARKTSWLSLVELTGRTLTLLLDLLGIEVPKRM